MSHRATNWAILQRGLKPATKIVLWHLCDRHNPDFGCSPTQARLAADAEMSVSALNEHLAKLEGAGLRSDASGRMTLTPTGVRPRATFWGSNWTRRPIQLRIRRWSNQS